MRHVSQHLEDYALDGRKRRQKAPASAELVGRRALEVMSWNENRFIWLGGTIDIAQAREAAARLYSAIRQVRDCGPT